MEIMIEVLGYVAAAVTFLGFLTSDVIKIRKTSLLACCIWVIYGILIKSGSVIICNLVIGILQATYIFKFYSRELFEELQKEISYLSSLKKEIECCPDAHLEDEYDLTVKKIKKMQKSFFY